MVDRASVCRGCAVLVLAAAVLLAGGCGSSSRGGSSTAGSSSSGRLKVGMVAVGRLNDHAFIELAYMGLLRAEKELGIEGRVLVSSAAADYPPDVTALAQHGYRLIIAAGSMLAGATGLIARQHPAVRFALVDADATALAGKPKNVEGLLFKEQEAGYLVGYLAGLYAKDNHFTTISSVGGQKVAPVDRYIAGYEAGARAADPGIKTLNGYSQDFVAQSRCKTIALGQIAAGSKVVFQVAGNCGLGALKAAAERGVQAIGVDADQSYLGSYILGSAEKKVDVAVYNAIKADRAGRFSGGQNITSTVASGGVGYGRLGPAGTRYAAQLAQIASEIGSGEIANIPVVVR